MVAMEADTGQNEWVSFSNLLCNQFPSVIFFR